ncbi:MAG TPA: dihydrodipicolinate synthase family protein [Roseiflexaceae bacterium]|nr:dihydrodipicolinate synthase family protein [Roseiflexaceae bacterium]HMP40235.1 dihydrodipicolinate synthase family protein [Roseiflexaceae bacterium]
MSAILHLPQPDRSLLAYTPGGARRYPHPAGPLRSRVAYAAAHVVADPLADTTPVGRPVIDWEATLAYRRHLWSYGFAVAEAMDTAQRGMGLDWAGAQELIRRALAEARSCGGMIACGAGTDHLPAGVSHSLDTIEEAYAEQVGFIEGEGGRIILMCSRALAANARGPEEYARVYGRILSQVAQPVILHWLGDMFDPALAGYWGSRDLDAATDAALQIIEAHADKVDGIKLSLLSKEREIALRRRLPAGVRMYTGDDFNYAELIAGDHLGYSDALLGIFDAIAPVASAAFQALDAGDLPTYHSLLEPTVPLSRHIFQAPTFYYKTGVVFLAYLNGHQNHFRMVGGQESARSVVHLATLFVLADRAGLLSDPELAITRMRHVLALAGIADS